MRNYSINDIRNMQDEAAARVREMHKKARQKVDMHNKAVRNTVPPESEIINPPIKKPPIFDIKKLIGSDPDRMLILCLIILLSQDKKCDESLLLALVYIML